MKKLILCLIISVFVLNLNAQEKGKIRVGIDGGLGFPNSGLGFAGGLDARYNITDNINAGIRVGGAALFKDIYVNTVTINGINNYLITSDYYFNNDKSSFAPFLGGGIGVNSIQNIKMTIANGASTSISNTSGFLMESKIGALFRGGFEAGHFRMTAEYHLIPNSKVVDLNNAIVGTTGNSYLNISIGFYIGGGYWRKIAKK